MKFFNLILIFLLFSNLAIAKELALTFDDAPLGGTTHYSSIERTEALIKKLKDLNVPKVMVFTNPCRGESTNSTITQLKKYVDSGHLIGNHTCNHPRLDNVGFIEFSKNAEKADGLLKPLLTGQKYFRFPYLNEGTDIVTRDQMREWLKKNKYRNGMVSIDNADYAFTSKVNVALDKGKKINYDKLKNFL